MGDVIIRTLIGLVDTICTKKFCLSKATQQILKTSYMMANMVFNMGVMSMYNLKSLGVYRQMGGYITGSS